MTVKPKIGVIPGDPSGIGPELIAKLLIEPQTRERADILLIGDSSVFTLGQEQAGLRFDLNACDVHASPWAELEAFAWHEFATIAADDISIAKETEVSGRSVLRTLDEALGLARDGVIDAILFAPFNKAAMHMAGLVQEDELHYIADQLGVKNYVSELNTLDGLWTSRVTSHIALRHVADAVSQERISEAIGLIDLTLKRAGVARPRIAVAALNPHAGDGGNFGDEEINIIRPAVKQAAQKQIAVNGPWPSDTVFLKARAGEIDAIVTMYHDQGQIALKLMGFDRGVTVQGGLPFPIATPAHGTAFDIAGKGMADVGATRAAFNIACDMATMWS